MTHLRNVSRRNALRAFGALGFEIDDAGGKGSHAIVFHPSDATRRTTLPRRDPVARGTLSAMLRDLRVSMDEFKKALGR